MELDILIYPDRRLKTQAARVEIFNDSLQAMIRNMADTMYNNKGIGLAATQVNIHQQIFVMDISGHDKQNFLYFINPVITNSHGSIQSEEGCLSIPGIFETVTRAEHITLQYQDMEGRHYSNDYSGLTAICIQHEIEHLQGKMFIERLSHLKQTFINKRIKKLYKTT